MVAANQPIISPGRAQDWISTVLNPIIDSVRRELRFLPSGPWRWVPATRSFEFFGPVSSYVPHGYTDNYDDFIEKQEAVLQEFGIHDGLLAAFATEFEQGFDLLRTSADAAEYRRLLDGVVPSPDSREWFISYTVGRFGRLPDYYVGYERYNPVAAELIDASQRALDAAQVDVLGRARELHAVDERLERLLVEARRQLADQYGARIKPYGSQA